MRTIKFRAWSFDPFLEEPEMLSWKDIDRLDTEGLMHLFDILSMKEKNVIPMQFTGLHDKNGKEIYEGDVIEWVSCNPFSIGEKRRVHVYYIEGHFWCHGSIGIYIGDLLANEKCEVIGNIYENPELINP